MLAAATPQRLLARWERGRDLVGDVDELHRNAHPVAGLAHAAFEHRLHVELAADHCDVLVPALELERRRARRHAQAADLREHVQKLVGETVRKILVFLVPAAVDERQHRNRRGLALAGCGRDR
ncbi:MAG TPA: hypothetical protein VF304_19075 [Casimicrobiaceae bacterium]